MVFIVFDLRTTFNEMGSRRKASRPPRLSTGKGRSVMCGVKVEDSDGPTVAADGCSLSEGEVDAHC